MASTPSHDHILRNMPALRPVPIEKSERNEMARELPELIEAFFKNGGMITELPAQEVPHRALPAHNYLETGTGA